jgi:hypothetical protein
MSFRNYRPPRAERGVRYIYIHISIYIVIYGAKPLSARHASVNVGWVVRVSAATRYFPADDLS